MPRPRKLIQDIELDQAVKTAAWEQIRREGASGLSLRGIARQLGIAAPSIYHYYPTRDALVTALIVDAFDDLAFTLASVLQAAPPDDPARRLAALGLAYRAWSAGQSERFRLIFGTPIPGYSAPEEVTLPAAAAGFAPLAQVLEQALSAGKLRVEQLPPATPPFAAMLEAWQQFEGGVDQDVLYMALTFWSRIHGLVMLEINGQIPSFITDPAEFYDRELGLIVSQYVRG